MLLAIFHMTVTDLQLAMLAVLGGNLAFIAALSYIPGIREKLMEKLIGV